GSRLPYFFSSLATKTCTTTCRRPAGKPRKRRNRAGGILPSGLPLRRRYRLLVRVQRQLVHAPVQNLAGIQRVLRRARQLVNPSELLRHAAGAAEVAEQLAL